MVTFFFENYSINELKQVDFSSYLDYNIYTGLLNLIKKGKKMKQTLEKLWNEYLLEKCAEIDTEKERKLTRKAAELNQKAIELLSDEQRYAVERYVETIHDIETVFAEKAFIRGCEFAVSFLLESMISETHK